MKTVPTRNTVNLANRVGFLFGGQHQSPVTLEIKVCLTSKTFPCPTLRDLACLFPLSHLGMTSFLCNEWEASAPQIGSRLPWFPPGQPAAPPPSSIFQPQQWAAPSQGHFPGTLLLMEEFLSFLLAMSRSHNRKAVTSPQLRKGVSLLP